MISKAKCSVIRSTPDQTNGFPNKLVRLVQCKICHYSPMKVKPCVPTKPWSGLNSPKVTMPVNCDHQSIGQHPAILITAGHQAMDLKSAFYQRHCKRNEVGAIAIFCSGSITP